MIVSQDALTCDCLVVAGDKGEIGLFNISKGFKQFTTILAYIDEPVHKAISYSNLFGLDRGMMTVGNDGCISVWQWKKPNKQDSGKYNWRGTRGRGGSRGGGRGRGGFQGMQGRAEF